MTSGHYWFMYVHHCDTAAAAAAAADDDDDDDGGGGVNVITSQSVICMIKAPDTRASYMCCCYADSVIQETCRLSSGVFMVRHVTRDTWFMTSDGNRHLIREGDRVAIYPPAIHKDAEIFDKPTVSEQLVSLLIYSRMSFSSYHRGCVTVTFDPRL